MDDEVYWFIALLQSNNSNKTSVNFGSEIYNIRINGHCFSGFFILLLGQWGMQIISRVFEYLTILLRNQSESEWGFALNPDSLGNRLTTTCSPDLHSNYS